jgi:hypothetical protein
MIRKIIAGFLSFVFISLFFVVSVVFGIFNTFLNVDFYDEEFVDVAYDFSLEQLSKNVDLSEFPAISESDFMDVLKKSFNKEDVSLIVDSFFDQMKNNVADENSIVEFRIPLFFIKEKREYFASYMADKLYETMDVCEGDVLSFSKDLDCIPAGLSKDDYKNMVVLTVVDEILKEVPNEFVFEVKIPTDYKGNLSVFFDGFMGNVFLICLAVLIFILLLLWLVIFRPWTRVLRWESKTLFWASFSVLAVFVGMSYAFERFVNDDYVYVISFFANALSGCFVYYLLPVLILSFGVWIFSVIFGKRKKADDDS